MACAFFALVTANSPLGPFYFAALHFEIAGMSLLHWINDGLMAIFFLLVGLEIKRELLEGGLSTWSRRALPGIAAVGGMAFPALIYVAVNAGEGGAPRGWAIPAATDIAFALGVVSLLGSRVPASLKVFLTALAILDDLGAVIIIALFYSADLAPLYLIASAAVVAALFLLNRFNVGSLLLYLSAGLFLWVLVLKSGIHPTLAGVALAAAIPLKVFGSGEQMASAPLVRLEHALSPWVAFLVVPIFGFANAGVSLGGISPSMLLDPIPLGVAAGLFFGKQAGVFGLAWLAIKLRWAVLPLHSTWGQLYGVATLCGIGFTMSLFIGLLAFSNPLMQDETKIGVLVGSLLAGLLGAVVIALCSKPAPHDSSIIECR